MKCSRIKPKKIIYRYNKYTKIEHEKNILFYLIQNKTWTIFKVNKFLLFWIKLMHFLLNPFLLYSFVASFLNQIIQVMNLFLKKLLFKMLIE